MKFCIALVALTGLYAQDTKPSCNRCQGTYIKNEEIQAYLKRVPPDVVVSDQQVRAVDVGKSNVDIGVVYRENLPGIRPWRNMTW